MHFEPRLWAFTKGFRARIFLAFLLGLIGVSVGIARLALLGWLLAQVIAGSEFKSLIVPLCLVALIMVVRGVIEHIRNMIAHRTAAKIQLVLRRTLYDRLVMLGPSFVTQQRSGELALTLIDGVEQLETYFGKYIPQMLVACFTPVIIFSFVIFIDVPVATVLLVASIVALFAPALWHKFDTKKSIEREHAYSEFASEFLDSVQGLATLKSFGQSRKRGQILTQKAHALFESTMWVLGTNTLSRGITDTAIAVGAAAALVLGAYRVIGGGMDLSALLIILLLGIEIFRPLRELRSVLHQGMVGKSAALSMYRLLDAQPVVKEPAIANCPNNLEASISFEEVFFQYPGQREVVHCDLNLSLKPGERVAVVGPSGCGKSSLVRLLQRFHDPQGGAVKIGNCNVQDLPVDLVRRQISVVHQDTFLFHGTVRENLLMGNPAATHDELVKVTEAANIHNFIEGLPSGYDTLIGEKGIKLSGGQRQRIAIARALLRDSPILILDEALSAVDAENEAIILDALERLMVGRTTLVLAHRLSSVINCDRIVVLDGGSVVEEGKHEELIENGGVYSALMSEQTHGSHTGFGDSELYWTANEKIVARDNFQDLNQVQPTEGIVKAEGLSWTEVIVILMKHILPWKAKVGLVFVFGVARVLAFIGVGVISAFIVLALKNGESFDQYITLLIFVAPAAGILHWCESWIAHDMAFRLLSELRIAVFNKLDALAPAYLTRRRTGDLMAIVTQDIEMVEYFFAHTVAPAFVSVLVPTTVVAVLWMYSSWLALSLLPFLIAVALSPFIMRGKVDELGSRAREAAGELSAHAIDSIQGLSEVLAFQDENRRGEQIDDLARLHIRLRLPYFEQLTLQQSLLEIFTGLGGLSVVISGALLVNSGSLDPGILPLLTILAMAAFLPISEIAEIGRQLADTLGATRRVYALEREPIPVRDGESSLSNFSIPSADLSAVSFSYPGHQQVVLDNISLEIRAGQTVALVGPSGAGKTTIAHLLMRFWDPDSGVISIGQHDIRDFALDNVRGQVALVAQDTYLFNDTLRNNIVIANSDATPGDIDAAISAAALDKLVKHLPDGLDTMVGERGTSLSGGQRQRVAIARAFLKDAPILILDEATSHLDAISEHSVRRALDQLKSNRTTIVIAHRLSTVRESDVILVIDGGRVAESGTHDALLARNGFYSRLVSRQIASSKLKATPAT